MKLRELIGSQAIVTSLTSTDRDGVIKEMIQCLVEAGSLESDAAPDIIAALIKREKSASTGFGKGVAVPHAKHPRVGKLTGAVGLSHAGIDFKAVDQKPVYSVFMLLSPLGQDQQHLQAMEVIFRNLNKDMFRRFLRQADTSQKVLDLLDEADQGM